MGETLTSPTLGLPMVDARCSHYNCADRDAYRLKGVCTNCQSQIVGLFTATHEASGYTGPACPLCGVQGRIIWKGLEDGGEVSDGE